MSANVSHTFSFFGNPKGPAARQRLMAWTKLQTVSYTAGWLTPYKPKISKYELPASNEIPMTKVPCDSRVPALVFSAVRV